MSLPISEQELIQRALESRLGDLYTALPGRVEAFYSNDTADVAPTITRPIKTEAGDIRPEELPILPNLLVCYPNGGGFSIKWPLHKGNHVIILVMTYALAVWRKTAETSAPGDLRLHHLTNSVAIPMLEPNHPEEASEEESPSEAMVIRGPLIILGERSGADYAALASKTDANFEAIKQLLTVTWVPVPNDGGAALKTAAAELSFDSVACDRVKIK